LHHGFLVETALRTTFLSSALDGAHQYGIRVVTLRAGDVPESITGDSKGAMRPLTHPLAGASLSERVS
jgi:hypothetical protein